MNKRQIKQELHDRVQIRVEEELIQENLGQISGTEVGRVIQQNVRKTSKAGGSVNLSIQRKKAVIAILLENGKVKHGFNAELKKDGTWKEGRTPLVGAPAKITKGQKTFDDETAAKALKALFNEA